MDEHDVLAFLEAALAREIDESRHRFARIHGVEQNSLEASQDLDGLDRGGSRDAIAGSDVVAIGNHVIARDRARDAAQIGGGAGKIEKGERVPLDVKVGDRILFGKYSGSEIKLDDQEYLILREEEILAKLGGVAKAASSKK